MKGEMGNSEGGKIPWRVREGWGGWGERGRGGWQ